MLKILLKNTAKNVPMNNNTWLVSVIFFLDLNETQRLERWPYDGVTNYLFL